MRRHALLAAGVQRTGTYIVMSQKRAFFTDLERSPEPADCHSSRTSLDRAFSPARASAPGQEGARHPAYRVRRRAGAREVCVRFGGARRADSDHLLGGSRGAATGYRNRLVCARITRLDAARLGDAALRSLLAAPGSRVRAA